MELNDHSYEISHCHYYKNASSGDISNDIMHLMLRVTFQMKRVRNFTCNFIQDIKSMLSYYIHKQILYQIL